MGEGLARDLISKGWNIACVDINVKTGEKLVSELGENAKFFQADVSSYESQATMFQNVWNTWGRIDALLANAGIPDRSSIYILKYRGSTE
jgi:NAD(P)-dependent dehydrogenase (short-subunit alcohol dehydrogenase family)